MNLPPTPAHLWTERYESLRRHFLQEDLLLPARPLGLAVLLRQGLACWMRAWQSHGQAERAAPPAPAQPWTPPPAPLWQQELTQLIAQMTLQQLQPVPGAP
jgi:hypothetical protein